MKIKILFISIIKMNFKIQSKNNEELLNKLKFYL